MGAFAAALDDVVTTYGPRCSVSLIFDELTGDNLDEFTAAMNDPAVQHVAIERALIKLRNDGEITTRVGKGAVGRHRKRECACFEAA